MIIECQEGRLLESRHVVEWYTVEREGDHIEDTHALVAKTALNTAVEVAIGSEEECEAARDKIKRALGEEHMMLRHLSRFATYSQCFSLGSMLQVYRLGWCRCKDCLNSTRLD